MIVSYFYYLMKIKFCCKQMLEYVSYLEKLVTIRKCCQKIEIPANIR
jgi:hypothetical protein